MKPCSMEKLSLGNYVRLRDKRKNLHCVHFAVILDLLRWASLYVMQLARLEVTYIQGENDDWIFKQMDAQLS